MEKSNKSLPLPKSNESLHLPKFLLNNSSSKTLSSEDTIKENFEWNDGCIDLQFLKFPLKKWYFIIYDIIHDSEDLILKEGGIYKNSVIKILKKDVFEGENLTEESENHIIISKDKEIKNFFINNNFKIIEPDFILLNIEKKKLLKILNEREYMMYLKGELPHNIDKINILGEIKNSTNKTTKTRKQRNSYISFIENYRKGYFILMNIFDVSYETFLNKKKNKQKTNNNVIEINCYIPKTYLHECYDKYNEIFKMKNGESIEWNITTKIIEENKEIIKKKLKEKKEYLENLKNNNLDINNLNEKIKECKCFYDYYTSNLTNILLNENLILKQKQIKINDYEKLETNEQKKSEEEKIKEMDLEIKELKKEKENSLSELKKKIIELDKLENELKIKKDNLKKEIENLEDYIKQKETELKELNDKFNEKKNNF